MSAIRATSALVIRCFRRVEHAADWLTGAAGPVFIALAWILTVFIGFAFCEPSLDLSNSSRRDCARDQLGTYTPPLTAVHPRPGKHVRTVLSRHARLAGPPGSAHRKGDALGQP